MLLPLLTAGLQNILILIFFPPPFPLPAPLPQVLTPNTTSLHGPCRFKCQDLTDSDTGQVVD